MTASGETINALAMLRQAVSNAYGDRIERIVLYGSRARGDAQLASDYDVAVFLRGDLDRPKEIKRLADIGTDMLYRTGIVVHALPYAAAAYLKPLPLMHEIRRDGIDL